jgi:ferredoxin--NADP+ reductase
MKPASRNGANRPRGRCIATVILNACQIGSMSNFNEERVVSVHHWTDQLFSFRTTRDPSFRFRNGEFTMIGIKVEGKPLLRAYSVVSANYEEELEFFSIKVQNGPLTSRLQHLQVGDPIIVSRKATGTLVLDNLLPGRNLYLLGTGTGLAPFLSIIKDPETYERFEKVVLVHGCRKIEELAYGDLITERLPDDELVGELIRPALVYYPTVTREPFRNTGRITDLIVSNKLFDDVGLPPMDRESDRFMLCGSPEMIRDTRELLIEREYVEGNHGEAGHFVIEKAFVEK